MKKLLLFIFIQFSLFKIFGNEPTLQNISGIILDNTTHQPVVGSVAFIKDGSLSSMADENGYFNIQKVAIGRHDVSVSSLGYKPYTIQNIRVNAGKETYLTIYIEEQVFDLPEITIKPTIEKELPLNKTALVSSRMFSSEEANRYAGSWGDPARMVANFAGVVAANDSRNDIIVRGNSPMGLLWLIDGYEIPNPNHFGSLGGTGGPLGMINNNLLDNSDFYTGAFPAEFGNVTSGIFDIKLKNGNTNKHEFLSTIGFNGAEFGAEGPISKKNKSTFLINGRYSFLGILSDFDFAGTQGATPNYNDLTAKINIPFKKSNLSLLSIIGSSNIKISPDIKDEEWEQNVVKTIIDSRNYQYFTGANYTIKLSNKSRIENRISALTFIVKNNLNNYLYTDKKTAIPYFDENNNDIKYSYQSKYYNRINQKNSINMGIGTDIYVTKLNETVFDYDNNQASRNLRAENNISNLYKAHIQLHNILSEKTEITPGVYAQFYQLNNNFSIEPRIGLKHKLNAISSINLGSGLHSKIQPKQLYFYKDENGLIPNKNVSFSKSWQSVAGYNLTIIKNLILRSEIYYQYLYDIPVTWELPGDASINMGDEYHNSWDFVFENKGTGENYGIELTIEKFFDKNYYYLITGTLYNSTYKPLDNIVRNTKFAGNFSLNVLGGYEFVINKKKQDVLSINSKISYLGNKRILPISYDNFSYEHVGGENPVFDYGNAYTKRMPDYFRFDINIAIKQNLKRASIESFFEILNVTNHKNVYSQYNIASKNETKYIYQNGFMPMGGCRIYF